MKPIDRELLLNAMRSAAMIFLAIIACRLTKGAFAWFLALLGLNWAMNNQLGKAVSCYMLFPFFVIMNPMILPKNTLCALALRLGPALMMAGLFLSASRRPGRHVLPLGAMTLYLVVAAMSSAKGYAPVISYLKIVNFVILLMGLWIGLKNLDRHPDDVMDMRCFMLGIAIVLVFGSALTLLVPSVGYLNMTSMLARDNPDMSMEEINFIVANMQGVRLFSGVTNQSQCLAVLLPCMLAWITCDMLFIERRVSVLHLSLILCSLPLIYMTRSRISFLATASAAVIIYFWCIQMVRIRARLKAAFRTGMAVALLVGAAYGAYSEVRHDTISRWLRKTEDVSGDQRSLVEAMTSSRLSLVDQSMRDFRRNPLFGKGFQVMEYMQGMSGFRLTAAIEKGVLPIMILGETGVVGMVAFVFFLLSFYGGCMQKRLYVTMALFTVMVACNFGEANFFSPGGPGGMLWVICVGGGFLIDTLLLHRRRLERMMRAAPPPPSGAWR